MNLDQICGSYLTSCESYKVPKIGGAPGIEPGTSRTLSGNHTTRPSALILLTLHHIDRYMYKIITNGIVLELKKLESDSPSLGNVKINTL